jgi:hypothetical protein
MEAAGAIALGRGDQELNHAIRVRVGERLEQNRVDMRTVKMAVLMPMPSARAAMSLRQR